MLMPTITTCFSKVLSPEILLMAQVENGSDYGSDIPTGLESEMFRSMTSEKTDQTLPVAGRTRNNGTWDPSG